MFLYNAQNVPSELITVNTSSTIFEQAGILHNQALFHQNQIFNALGNDPDEANVGYYACKLAQQLENSQVLPTGSAAILIQGINSFLAVSDFYTGINVWGNLFNQYKQSSPYQNTPLIGVLSIGYYSSQYWAYVIQTSNAGHSLQPDPAPEPSMFKLRKWLKTALSDLVGAMSGASDGGEIGSLIPGVGTTVGAVVGAVVEGVVGSLLAASA